MIIFRNTYELISKSTCQNIWDSFRAWIIDSDRIPETVKFWFQKNEKVRNFFKEFRIEKFSLFTLKTTYDSKSKTLVIEFFDMPEPKVSITTTIIASMHSFPEVSFTVDTSKDGRSYVNYKTLSFDRFLEPLIDRNAEASLPAIPEIRVLKNTNSDVLGKLKTDFERTANVVIIPQKGKSQNFECEIANDGTAKFIQEKNIEWVNFEQVHYSPRTTWTYAQNHKPRFMQLFLEKLGVRYA